MMNLIFLAGLAISLAQAAWVRTVSGTVEAWEQLGPRLLALLVVMLITTSVRKLVETIELNSIPLVTYSSVVLATVALIVVVTYAACYIVASRGDFGWCLIAVLCVVAQGFAIAPMLKARRRTEA